MTDTRSIPCYCENVVELSVPDEVDLAAEPARLAEIREGRFLTVVCPRCGTLLKPEFAVRIIDSSKGWEIQLVPEIERGSYLTGKTSYRLRGSQRGRVVIGYPELVEKLAIFGAGLDDRAVELIKFYLAEKAGDPPDLAIYFKERSEGRLVFHLHGLKPGEVGVSRLTEELYERTLRDLSQRMSEEPFDAMLGGPYVSYRMVAVEDAP